MAEKQIFLVEDSEGARHIVKAETGSQARKAMTPELTVKRASPMDVAEALANGGTLHDAEAILARRQTAAPESTGDDAPAQGLDAPVAVGGDSCVAGPCASDAQ